MTKLKKRGCIAILNCLFSASGYASCGASFCTVNTDWQAQGAWSEPGWQADLRYEYLSQDKPMSGSQRVGVGQIPAHHDEVRTINRNTLLGLSYTTANGWGYVLQLPWVTRDHMHIHHHHGEDIDERWQISELGDVRLSVRHALGKDTGWDAQLGLKLPTGRIAVANSDGDVAERSLQPGSGSTDTLLGVSYHSAPGRGAESWFAQSAWQHTVAIRDGYKPGDKFLFDAGWRYRWTQNASLLLQANFQIRERDKGPNAEDDSGGRVLFISPGLSYAVTPQTQAYLFVQLPLYTFVNGVQLTSGKNVTFGFSSRF